MADHRRALPGADAAGGSLSLAGLLDEHGETLYLDLKQHWGFDLAEFFAGEVSSSPRLILALIRGLPEDSRWTRFMSTALDGAQDALAELLSDEEREHAEEEFWTPDRLLLAQIHNAIVTNTQATGRWKDNKAPELPLMGPERLTGRLAQPTAPTGPQPGEEGFLLHHFARLGMPAGGGRL